ncbi:MAG: hypothetical protein KTR31_07715 [Myxococcales bacterium]|nr:hypothetical protein [Myxococcales bacterium]
MSANTKHPPTPFHCWIEPYVRGDREVAGHWRVKNGCHAIAEAFVRQRPEMLRMKLSSNGGLAAMLARQREAQTTDERSAA